MKNIEEKSNLGVKFKWFSYSPNKELIIVVFTELLMIAGYYASCNLIPTEFGLIGVFLLFGIAINLFLNVIFPVWWVNFHNKEPLSALGITKQKIFVSLIINIACSLMISITLITLLSEVENAVSHFVFNFIIFWEPFFVYCWLQLRYEKYFGIIPGMFLAALSFMAYHIGTFPSEFLLPLFLSGLFYAIIFRITKNILIIWPFSFAMGSFIGTLQFNAGFNWEQVMLWSIILAVQITFIWITSRHNKTLKEVS